MYYGNEKIRQMARSLLPSCSRKSAREWKRLVKKSFKCKNRVIVKNLKDESVWEEATLLDDRREVREVVKNRQGADKVGPFVNWVTEKTKDMRQEDRKAYVRGLLPNNLIGYHAMTHLPYKGFDHPNVDYVNSLPKLNLYHWERGENGKYQRVHNKKAREWTRENLCLAVREMLENGFHKKLNGSIRHNVSTKIVGKDALGYPIYANVGPTRPRLCLGIHDIESFVDDVLEAQWGTKEEGSAHAEWFFSLTQFLKKWY